MSKNGDSAGRMGGGRSSSHAERLSAEEKARALRARRALALFMEQMPGAVVTDVALLLSIASEHIGQGEHAERLGLDRSGASVAVRRLGQGGRGAYRKGMDWVAYEPDPNDDRRKIPVLTASGEMMVRTLLDALAPN